MDFFWFTVSKKELRRLKNEEEPEIAKVFYVGQVWPDIDDRVCFNNFDDMFVVTEVREVENWEATNEFMAIALVMKLKLLKFDQEFEIIGLRDLVIQERYEALGEVSGDVYDLLTQFELEGVLAEEGDRMMTETERNRVIMKVRKSVAEDVWTEMMPSLFGQLIRRTNGHSFERRYDPHVAYLDGLPIALVGRYSELPLEDEEGEESYVFMIYVDEEYVDYLDLELAEVQFIIEQLFLENLERAADEGCDTDRPLVILPLSQAEYAEGLASGLDWEPSDDHVVAVGYQVYNGWLEDEEE